MDFSLSSSLVGSAVSNPDKLALDLQFAADKTLTARKGPTPAFTRASSATFVGSNGLIQSAGNNVARFDHDPVSLACKGLLIEESRTNTLIQSNDFANVAWVKSNIGIGSTTNLSPDGSNNATLLIAGTASVSWIFRSGITNSGSTVTFFAKSSGKRWAVVDASSGAGTAGVWFDLQNGVVGTVQSGYTASIQQFPNGFYRCRVTYPSSGAGTFCVIGVSDNNGLFTSTASGSNGIIFYGAQLEAGSFPTSYIPTTTASVIRSADVCSITASAFSGFYNPLEGTAVAVASANGFTTTNNSIYGIESGTTVVTRVFNRVAQGSRLSSQISATTLTPTVNYNSTNVVYKSALAADINGADYVIDGTQIPDSYAGSSLSADNLKFTGISGSTSNNTISSFRYYKKRLPVAKLQTLTV